MTRALRSFGFLACLTLAAGVAASITNCAAPDEEEADEGGDAVTGAENRLGLSVIYDAESNKVHATLGAPLAAGDKLFLRVSRGTIRHESEKNLDCNALASSAPAKSAGFAGGKALYVGPSVDADLLRLIGLFNDSRWYGGRETPEMRAEAQKGPDAYVEACVMRGATVRAKVLTNLAFAWDRGKDLAKQAGGSLKSSSLGGDLHFNAGDGGTTGVAGQPADDATVLAFLNDASTTLEILDDKVGLDRRQAVAIITRRNGPDGAYPSTDDHQFTSIRDLDDTPRVGSATIRKIREFLTVQEEPRLREGEHYSTIKYASLCVQELGEIPFFKKLGNGKYDSFDCRDFVGTKEDGSPTGAIPGVEGAVVPLTVDDQPQTECSGGRTSTTYDCVDKCDRGMWLTASSHTGLGRKAACQPGVTVTTAKNDKGTNWILLCRKVDNSNGDSMMKTKVFNDIAIIGNNPRSGQTCFFQNKENIGNDGRRVTHPADVARSSAIWPSEPSSYCTKNCHATDAFVHSPWIDQAKRSDGTPIVPMMGKHSDYPISDLTFPYRLLNGPSQGFQVPLQFNSEVIAPCTTCHRAAGAAFAEFSEWATGTGDAYYGKITDRYKAFEKSHWMPLRLDGLTAENFASSPYGKAVEHLRKCTDNPNLPECSFANIPEE